MQNKTIKKTEHWAAFCLLITFVSSSNTSHSPPPSVPTDHWGLGMNLRISSRNFCNIISNLLSSPIQKQRWSAVQCWTEEDSGKSELPWHMEINLCGQSDHPVRFSPSCISWEAAFSSPSTRCRAATARAFALRTPHVGTSNIFSSLKITQR